MYSFANDYSEGAHPRILEMMMKTNLEQNSGYGLDSHCEHAAALIKRECGRNDIEVHFIPGGTQTNLLAISKALRPHEAVISAETGHINCHETGAVEATGHKILSIASEDGKLYADGIQTLLRSFGEEFAVLPKMLYISNTTELGTQYTKEELAGLSRLCRQNGMFLFLDGARLASALTSGVNDITLEDLAQLTDMFYIGGTKNGALFGEALVLVNPELKPYFRFQLKQRGAMLAKGWLLGIQFETLFTDGLFYELGEHANRMAALLRNGFEERGFTFLSPSQSNQVFPIVSDVLADKLAKKYVFNTERNLDNDIKAIRFVTSWATPEMAIQDFLRDLDDCISSTDS